MGEASGTGDYILGTDARELERLRVQHEVWVHHARALWSRAGFGPGSAVLDLGCGPGYTSLELARHVGPEGRVVACDRNAGFLAHLEAERARLGLAQIEIVRVDVAELDAERVAGVDGAYARWLFCWLEDPGDALARAARAVRPGGALALHEYLDWAAMKLVPRSAAFDRIVEACMASFRAGGARIDVAEELPALARARGLVVDDLRAVARVGAAGSPVWRWIETFLGSYLPRLVERGLLAPADHEACREDWERHAERGDAHCVGPTLAELLLRRP